MQQAYQDGGGNAQAPGPPNAGFAAHPRVVKQKPKFKDPYGGVAAPE